MSQKQRVRENEEMSHVTFYASAGAMSYHALWSNLLAITLKAKAAINEIPTKSLLNHSSSIPVNPFLPLHPSIA